MLNSVSTFLRKVIGGHPVPECNGNREYILAVGNLGQDVFCKMLRTFDHAFAATRGAKAAFFAAVGDSPLKVARCATNPHKAMLELSTIEISSELFNDVLRKSAAISLPLGDKRFQIGCNRFIEDSLFWAAPAVGIGFELLGLHTETEMITTESSREWTSGV